MKKIIFSLVLLLTTSTSFAFTQAEIDNCKYRVTKAYNTECKSGIWNGSSYTVGYDNDCQPGYDAALARCDIGKVWLYKKKTHPGTSLEVFRMDMIYKSQFASDYTDKMEVSIHQTTGYPSIKHCFFTSQSLSWFGFFTADNYCAGYNINPFVFDYTTTKSYREYFEPHIIGYSYPDTAQTVPIYSCQGTFQDYIFYPTVTTKTYYFLSFESGCNGKTPLNQIMGYGLNLNP